MLRKFSSLVLMGVCGAVATSALVFGQESTQLQGNVAVGSRAEPSEVRIAAEKVSAALAKANNTSKKKNTALLARGAGIHYTTHPGAYHSPVGISLMGDVELEDGSVWQVSPVDAAITRSWMPSDLVVITPNHSWFSSYQFKITNQNTGQAVLANLTLGPIYNGLYTRWITAIDYYYSVVYLDDGSVWNMSTWDSGTVDKWEPNDTVIIGVSDGLFSSTHPNILINVNMLNYAAGVTTF